MGVAWLLIHPTPDGKTHNQTLEDFGKVLISQGFEKDQSYNIKCESYVSILAPSLQKSFHAVCDSDRPASCFLISDKDPTMLNITAERSLMAFIGKLDKAYTAKKQSVVEVQGTSYFYRDFLVRAGILTFSGAAKGVLVEVELRSCPVAINAMELMKEFVNGFMPYRLDSVPAFFVQHTQLQTGMFSVMDTMVQYLEIFSHVRKTSQMPSR